MQTIGVSPAAIAASILRLTIASDLAEQPPPLGVSDDHVRRAGLLDHRRRHLARERAFALPVQSCAATAMFVPRSASRHRMQRGEHRRDDNVDAAHVLDDGVQIADEGDRLAHGLEHLPVAGDEWCAHRVSLG